MGSDYLLCEKCGAYYKLPPGESPDQFDNCECGGKLVYLKNINGKFFDLNNNQFIPVTKATSTIKISLTISAALFLILGFLTVAARRMSDFLIILFIFTSFTTALSILLLIPRKRGFRKVRPLKDRLYPRLKIIIAMFILISLCIRVFIRLAIMDLFSSTILFIFYLIIMITIVLSVFYYLRYVKKWI